VNDLAETQSGSVGGHQQRPVLESRSGVEQALHLLAAEDLGQPPRLPRRRDRKRVARPAERDVIQELQAARHDIAGAPTELPFLHQVHEVVLHLAHRDRLRRAPIVPRQPGGRADVCRARLHRHPPHQHVLFHPLP